MIAYAQGLAALKTGRIDNAIDHLTDAIHLKPEDAQYRYTLAMAYEKAEKWPNRWFQLRQAALLKPDYTDAIQELLDMWQVAVNKGVMDIGTSSEQIKLALGEPDRQQSEGDNSTWQYAFMGIQFQDDKLVSVFDLRALEHFTPPLEVIEFGFDGRDWKLNQQRIELQRTLLQYIPAAGTSDNEEIVTVERLFNLRKEMSVHELMNDMHKNLQEKFPGIEWNVIEESNNDNDILLEWRLQSEDTSAQHEIIRLLSGQDDIYRLAYTAHKIEDREIWLKILQQSKLTKE
jgi:tetratricopeptide (TPR) repeat protein